MEDFEIINRYHSRDSIAISQTASKYGTLLYAIAHGVLHSHEDSEETVNDTYCHAWDAMPPQRPTSLRAFLSRITRNLSIDRYRKSHAQKREGILVELSEFESDFTTTEDAVNLKDLTASIEKFLRKQSKDDRVLFMKRYFFDHSLSDLAQESESSVNQISSRLYRLRQKLKQQLEQEGYVL
ncbi:sigma-70 family RNA polymerase sigma factor [Bengtsoniella intestinalis]|uniref:RNA polymerase sigma factor n=1 Tax=Bengtsoniella intestinalis TaxID=3073143 RepID=UPI00391F510C